MALRAQKSRCRTGTYTATFAYCCLATSTTHGRESLVVQSKVCLMAFRHPHTTRKEVRPHTDHSCLYLRECTLDYSQPYHFGVTRPEGKKGRLGFENPSGFWGSPKKIVRIWTIFWADFGRANVKDVAGGHDACTENYRKKPYENHNFYMSP